MSLEKNSVDISIPAFSRFFIFFVRKTEYEEYLFWSLIFDYWKNCDSNNSIAPYGTAVPRQVINLPKLLFLASFCLILLYEWAREVFLLLNFWIEDPILFGALPPCQAHGLKAWLWDPCRPFLSCLVMYPKCYRLLRNSYFKGRTIWKGTPSCKSISVN